MKLSCMKYVLLCVIIFCYNIAKSQIIYCTPDAGGCSGISITYVQFGSIKNTSACGGYTDYTKTIASTTVNAGSSVPLTVSFTAWEIVYGTGFVKAWFDFNQNGVFEDVESFDIGFSGANSTQTFSIGIPFNAVGGTTRMRVRIENSTFGDMIPCIKRTSGETEDYAVNIIPSQTPEAHLTVYVNETATGGNDGSSWANALISLPKAFTIAKPYDTIKVAKGNYTPHYQFTNNVVYLGGYPNTGNPTDADRNFSVNPTVISGHNIYGINLENNTIINGFIFEKLEPGYSYENKWALSFSNSSPTITNCIFRNNQYNVLYITASNPKISNCFFINNFHLDLDISDKSSVIISNCVFNKNAYSSLINADNSSLKVVNCTFSNNQMHYSEDRRNFAPVEIYASNHSSANVANCIFSDQWSVTSEVPSKLTELVNVTVDSTSLFSLSNSITNYNQTGTNILRQATPKFKDEDNIAGKDGLFFTADDGLQVTNPCSVAMDAGLNASVVGTMDILGNKRIVSSAVDIGAYEIQALPAIIPKTIFVNSSAKGLNNGSSWANAFTDLQIAFISCSDTIKVAAGDYFPSKNNPDALFSMQNNRVVIGGYPNTGNPDNSLRNPAINPAVLNGNLLVNDIKSVNIVQALLVDSTAVLDGFTVTGAAAGAIYIAYNANPVIKNCTIHNNIAGAGIYKNSNPLFIHNNFNSNSSGIQINNSVPVIDSCVFNFNTIGAINSSNQSKAIITNCSFFKNTNINGADFFNDNSSPYIFNCVSDSAYASVAGASIANTNNSNPTITKCIFKNSQYSYTCYNENSKPSFLQCSFINSLGYSGSFYNVNSKLKLESCLGYGSKTSEFKKRSGPSFMTNSASTVDLINCSILKTFGGETVIANNDNSLLNIKNSIFWDNNFTIRNEYPNVTFYNNYPTEIINTASVTNISNSITLKYGTNGIDGNKVGVDPRFIDSNNPAGKDSIYGTPDDGVALCNCSPAINSGTGTGLLASTDITGNARVFNAVPDMGAYEYQSGIINPSKTFYVSGSAIGSNTGVDWKNAYTSLKDAIKNSCTDTIKIMEGMYKPAINNRDSSFEITRKLYLLGGYKNTASPTEEERDPDNYPTILSGEIGNQNDSTDNSYCVLKISYTDTPVKIDGLTFSDCFLDKIGNYNPQSGGAIWGINNNQLFINNCRFTHNHSTNPFSASSLKSYYSHIDVAKTVFSKNYSSGGQTFEIDGGTVNNCVFAENLSNWGSNIITTGVTDFKNCIFYKNFASNGGAGVLNEGSTTLLNCDFIKNSASELGAGFRNNNGGRAYLLNCVFSGNFNSGPYTGSYLYADWYDYRGAPSGESQYGQDRTYFNIVNSVYVSPFPYQTTIATSGEERFMNILDPIGPDNKWFTNDDGLQLMPCSPLIDTGSIVTAMYIDNSRSLVLPVTDIMDSVRIVGTQVDIGAYEYPGYINPVIAIHASDSVICADSKINFTVDQTGLGSNPDFQWQVNGVSTGTNSNKYESNLLKNNDQVNVKVTGKDTCINGIIAYSKIIPIIVKTNVAPSATITTSTDSICLGANANFIATTVNGGEKPLYQWQVNGLNTGSNTNAFSSSILKDKAIVTLNLTSSLTCALPASTISNSINMAVSPLPIADAGKDVSVCAGSGIQLNGSGGIVYTWYPAVSLSNNLVSNPTATPGSTTTYILTVANAGKCLSKDSVVVSVNQLLIPAINISTNTNKICAGSAILFTTSATNAGTNPTYQWQVNNVGTGVTTNLFTTANIKDKDMVKVILTSSETCLTSVNAVSNIISIAVQSADTPVVNFNNKLLEVINPHAGAVYTLQVNTNNIWQNILPIVNGTSFTILTNGNYRVMEEMLLCTTYSQSRAISYKTITPHNEFGINLYPNPASNTIVLDAIQIAQHWQKLTISNLAGQPVFSTFDITNQAMVSIDISSLKKGSYYVHLTRMDGVSTTIKFVKM